MHVAGLCGLLFAQEAECCVRLGEGECQRCVGCIGRGGGVGVVRWGGGGNSGGPEFCM